MAGLIKTIPSFPVRCPNHGVKLEGMPFPLPARGVGMCPVSGADFEFEVEIDETKVRVDKNGNSIKEVGWKLTGTE